MRSARIRRYGLSIALPGESDEVVPYEVTWDSLIRDEVDRKALNERLELLRQQEVLPIVAIFIPKDAAL